MGLGLAIIAASLAGAAISDEVKHYKETGEISRSAQNTASKLVEVITKSVLK